MTDAASSSVHKATSSKTHADPHESHRFSSYGYPRKPNSHDMGDAANSLHLTTRADATKAND